MVSLFIVAMIRWIISGPQSPLNEARPNWNGKETCRLALLLPATLCHVLYSHKYTDEHKERNAIFFLKKKFEMPWPMYGGDNNDDAWLV
jgi:hypothetical protein